MTTRYTGSMTPQLWGSLSQELVKDPCVFVETWMWFLRAANPYIGGGERIGVALCTRSFVTGRCRKNIRASLLLPNLTALADTTVGNFSTVSLRASLATLWRTCNIHGYALVNLPLAMAPIGANKINSVANEAVVTYVDPTLIVGEDARRDRVHLHYKPADEVRKYYPFKVFSEYEQLHGVAARTADLAYYLWATGFLLIPGLNQYRNNRLPFICVM